MKSENNCQKCNNENVEIYTVLCEKCKDEFMKEYLKYQDALMQKEYDFMERERR